MLQVGLELFACRTGGYAWTYGKVMSIPIRYFGIDGA